MTRVYPHSQHWFRGMSITQSPAEGFNEGRRKSRRKGTLRRTTIKMVPLLALTFKNRSQYIYEIFSMPSTNAGQWKISQFFETMRTCYGFWDHFNDLFFGLRPYTLSKKTTLLPIRRVLII